MSGWPGFPGSRSYHFNGTMQHASAPAVLSTVKGAGMRASTVIYFDGRRVGHGLNGVWQTSIKRARTSAWSQVYACHRNRRGPRIASIGGLRNHHVRRGSAAHADRETAHPGDINRAVYANGKVAELINRRINLRRVDRDGRPSCAHHSRA